MPSSQVARVAAVSTVLAGAALAAWALWRSSASPLPLTMSLLVTGAVLAACGIGIHQRSRAAWAFAVSVLGVLAAAGVFAIPGVVRAGVPPVAIGVGLALILGLLFLLISGRDQL